jgi:hypothetical protein
VAAHDLHDDDDLPATWPFTLAGVLLIVALVVFCAHFAIADAQEVGGGEKVGIKNVWDIFFSLLGAGAALVVGGAAYNIWRSHRRRVDAAGA